MTLWFYNNFSTISNLSAARAQLSCFLLLLIYRAGFSLEIGRNFRLGSIVTYVSHPPLFPYGSPSTFLSTMARRPSLAFMVGQTTAEERVTCVAAAEFARFLIERALCFSVCPSRC